MGKRGALITNISLNSKKFEENYNMLERAFNSFGASLSKMTNFEGMKLLSRDEVSFDFVVFWDKDVYLNELLQKKGYRVFNSASAIRDCDDKGLTYIRLSDARIKMPRTILAPKQFPSTNFLDFSYLDYVMKKIEFPMIVKENFGSFGHQVYLVKNEKELVERVKLIGEKPHLFQEFIKTSFGRDLRVQVVGREVVACVLRTAPPGLFQANVTSGGRMSVFEPDQSQKDMALKAIESMQLDFGGVDILFGDFGEPILCEVNSNAQLKNLYDASGVDASISIAKYVLEKIR